ncbi:MAG: hypothetical protein L7S56_04000, partial [Candidatus Poseidonia sp.]|nr:hypothetical protein [Poseidonia sp.]
MSDEHSARAGSLNAHLTLVMMEIDDDDEDIVIVVVDVVNESSIPVGGINAALVTEKGVRFEPTEGISSIGPGLTRQFKFEARIDTGEWTFEFSAGGQTMQLGPYDCAFEFEAEKGRQLGNAIGSTLFSGAFDTNLDAFGQTEERGIIDPSSIVLTTYVGENAEGGATKVIRGDAANVNEDEGPRTPPWQKTSPTPPLNAPEPAPPAASPTDLLTPLTMPLSSPSPPEPEPSEPAPLTVETAPIETAPTPPPLPKAPPAVEEAPSAPEPQTPPAISPPSG